MVSVDCPHGMIMDDPKLIILGMVGFITPLRCLCGRVCGITNVNGPGHHNFTSPTYVIASYRCVLKDRETKSLGRNRLHRDAQLGKTCMLQHGGPQNQPTPSFEPCAKSEPFLTSSRAYQVNYALFPWGALSCSMAAAGYGRTLALKHSRNAICKTPRPSIF